MLNIYSKARIYMEHSKTVGEWLTKPYQTVEKTWQTSLILKKPELTPQVASS